MDEPINKPDAKPPDAKPPDAAQVQAILDAEHVRVASLIRAPEDIILAWQDYRRECEGGGRGKISQHPTFGGFALHMGFCEEEGLRFLERRGDGYVQAVRKVKQQIVELVVGQLLKRGGNCVGAIFWLKNKAGFRDKSKEESAEAREDWLTQLQAAAAGANRADAPPQSEPPLQLVDGQEDALDSGMLPSDDSRKSVSG